MSQTADLPREARSFCEQAHAGQTRRNGAPYAEHPIRVAELLRSAGQNEPAILAAAYLHDVLEDTEISREELAERFGEPVCHIVDELTNPAREQPFEEKHRALAEQARSMTPAAKWIKLADRLDNLAELADRPTEKQRAYIDVTRELLEALRPWPSEDLARRIEEKIAEFEAAHA